MRRKYTVRIEVADNGYIITQTVDQRLAARFIEGDVQSACKRISRVLKSIERAASREHGLQTRHP